MTDDGGDVTAQGPGLVLFCWPYLAMYPGPRQTGTTTAERHPTATHPCLHPPQFHSSPPPLLPTATCSYCSIDEKIEADRQAQIGQVVVRPHMQVRRRRRYTRLTSKFVGLLNGPRIEQRGKRDLSLPLCELFLSIHLRLFIIFYAVNPSITPCAVPIVVSVAVLVHR
ncbi:hypothetical protein IWX50DRAFT_78489 [Phyllosticta citricarpa]